MELQEDQLKYVMVPTEYGRRLIEAAKLKGIPLPGLFDLEAWEEVTALAVASLDPNLLARPPQVVQSTSGLIGSLPDRLDECMKRNLENKPPPEKVRLLRAWKALLQIACLPIDEAEIKARMRYNGGVNEGASGVIRKAISILSVVQMCILSEDAAIEATGRLSDGILGFSEMKVQQPNFQDACMTVQGTAAWTARKPPHSEDEAEDDDEEQKKEKREKIAQKIKEGHLSMMYAAFNLFRLLTPNRAKSSTPGKLSATEYKYTPGNCDRMGRGWAEKKDRTAPAEPLPTTAQAPTPLSPTKTSSFSPSSSSFSSSSRGGRPSSSTDTLLELKGSAPTTLFKRKLSFTSSCSPSFSSPPPSPSFSCSTTAFASPASPPSDAALDLTLFASLQQTLETSANEHWNTAHWITETTVAEVPALFESIAAGSNANKKPKPSADTEQSALKTDLQAHGSTEATCNQQAESTSISEANKAPAPNPTCTTDQTTASSTPNQTATSNTKKTKKTRTSASPTTHIVSSALLPSSFREPTNAGIIASAKAYDLDLTDPQTQPSSGVFFDSPAMSLTASDLGYIPAASALGCVEHGARSVDSACVSGTGVSGSGGASFLTPTQRIAQQQQPEPHPLLEAGAGVLGMPMDFTPVMGDDLDLGLGSGSTLLDSNVEDSLTPGLVDRQPDANAPACSSSPNARHPSTNFLPSCLDLVHVPRSPSPATDCAVMLAAASTSRPSGGNAAVGLGQKSSSGRQHASRLLPFPDFHVGRRVEVQVETAAEIASAKWRRGRVTARRLCAKKRTHTAVVTLDGDGRQTWVRLPSTDVRPLVQELVSDEGVCYELCRPSPGMRSWLPTCLRGLYMVSSTYLASRVVLATLSSTCHTAYTTGQHIPHTGRY